MPTDPVLTPEGIQLLIDQLKKEMDAAKKSTGTVSDVEKQLILTEIPSLTDLLDRAKNDLENLPTWTVKIQPKFDKLTPLLTKALNLTITLTDQGACRYQGGCIVTNKTQCQGLGGIFSP